MPSNIPTESPHPCGWGLSLLLNKEKRKYPKNQERGEEEQ